MVVKDHPSKKALYEALPREIWSEVLKQCGRSTLGSFKCGAIIFDSKTLEIVGKGCSHHKEGSLLATQHAESHALRESYGERNYGENFRKKFSIAILTIGKAGNLTWSSRPCYSCAIQLKGNDIDFVYYPERLNNGEWIVNIETPATLLNRADITEMNGSYAKDMRI